MKMKKTILIISGMLAVMAAHAQTAYDALRFSENDYEGTARTMAMGNAFTALGGDLGSISINPAGSAVAKYSQLTLTPALSISSATAQGVSPYSDGSLPYFERQMKSDMTRLAMPNFGLTFHWDTHRTSGLKNMTFGFIVNRTASWNNDTYARGTNSSTSFMGQLAAEATMNGYLVGDLSAKDAYDFMPWKPVVGYMSGMISTFGGYDDQYVGASEVIFDNGDIMVGGPLEQTYGSRETGSRYEYLFNVAANISDFVYIGATLGLTSLDYNYNDYFVEQAIDPSDFDITLDNNDKMYFKEMTYKYSYSAVGSGAYGKFGVIVTPVPWFRVGAAIQTPTVNNISEYWQESGETLYSNANYNLYEASPEGRWSYQLVSPFRANIGAAFTFGSRGLISADYEVCDYGQMKYISDGYSDRDYFEDINADIRARMGVVQALRLGGEFKPVPSVAVRAGYGVTNSAQRNEYDSYTDSYYEIPVELTHNVALGVGYSSKKSFFADLAVRRTFVQREFVMPYADYIFNEDGSVNENAYAPEIGIDRRLWKVLLTLGWRF